MLSHKLNSPDPHQFKITHIPTTWIHVIFFVKIPALFPEKLTIECPNFCPFIQSCTKNLSSIPVLWNVHRCKQNFLVKVILSSTATVIRKTLLVKAEYWIWYSGPQYKVHTVHTVHVSLCMILSLALLIRTYFDKYFYWQNMTFGS